MSRIGATLTGIERSLLNNRAEAEAAIALATLRKSTGQMITKPADDPSVFVTLSRFQTQLSDVRTVMSNTTAASSLVSQTQGIVDQVSTQLDTIRTELLKDEDGSLTAEQRAESQAVIDQAVDTILTLSDTVVDNRRVLDGTGDFRKTGVNAQRVARLDVYALGSGRSSATSRSIQGEVQVAATQATLTYTGKAGAATVQADATFTLTGQLGSHEFTVAENDDLADVRDSINQYSHQTGVTASLSGDVLTFASTDYGDGANIEVSVSNGTFSTAGGNGDDTADGTAATLVVDGRTYGGTTSDTQARLFITGKAGAATVQANAQFTLTGDLGNQSFTINEDDSLAVIRGQINSAGLGVTASLDGDVLTITSDASGSSAEIDIDLTSGTLPVAGGFGNGRARGTDATIDASTDANTGPGRLSGNTFTYSDNGFRYQMELAGGYAGPLGSIEVSGEALTFALSSDLSYRNVLAIPSVAPAQLGGAAGSLDQLATGGSLAGLGSNTSQAIRVVDQAIGQLDRIQGNVDGFYNAQVATASSLLSDMETELNDTITEIDGVDDTEQDEIISYYQGLADNAIASIAILQQQRNSIIQMIQRIAGLT